MTNLLLFIAGLLAILLIARTNKSNKVFWTGLTVYLLSIVGGGLATTLIEYDDDNKSKATQVSPTQGCLAPSLFELFDKAEPDHNRVTFVAKLAGKDELVRDMAVVGLTPQVSGISFEGEPPQFVNTS